MSTSPDDQPTTVLGRQTAEQPAVTTSPPADRRRAWQRQLPAHLGRARTSTVVIGVLFLLLGGVNTVLPTDPYVPVTTDDGQVVYVRQSEYTPVPTTTPAPTAPASTSAAPRSTTAAPTTTPRTTTPRTTTSAPAPTDDDETPAPETTEEQETPPATSSSAAPSSTRAPATTADATSATPTS